MKKTKKHSQKLIWGIFFIFLLLVSGCSEPKEVTQEIKETPVAVARAYNGSLSGSNQITGTAKAGADVEVMPTATGKLIKLEVANGDVVEKGQVLAKIDDTQQKLAVEAEEKRVQQAENALSRATNGKNQAEKNRQQSAISLKQAEGSIAEAKEARESNLKNVQIEVTNVEKQYEEAVKNLDRMQTLYNEGYISLQQLEQAESAERQARLGLEQVKLKKAQVESELSLKNLQTTIDQAKTNIQIAEGSIKDSEIAIKDAKISIEQANISLSSAKKQLEDTVIKAPVSGKIMNLTTEVGEFVSGQMPFLRIISDDTLDVQMMVSAEQLMFFETGDIVEVQFAGQNNRSSGTVTYIAPAADEGRLFAVDVRVTNSDKKIKPGMVATVFVEEVLVEDSLIVPSAAVIERQDGTYVYVIENNVAVRKDIEVIRFDTDFTAIRGDIKEEVQVVIKGQNLLADGDLVRIVKEEK